LAAEKNATFKRETINGSIEISRTGGKEVGLSEASGSKALLGGIFDLCGAAFPILVDSMLDEKKLN
jgi:hypothetical protein